MLAMRKIVAIVGVSLMFACALLAQPCLNSAKEVAPVLSKETRELYEKNLRVAEAVHAEKLNEAEPIIMLGRRTAYLGNYKSAIYIYSSGLSLHKTDARFLRHRGHRYLTLRCLDDAIQDFENAAKSVKGRSDEIEQDGLPNARNIPTGTLQSNIWYHLGLAYYLKGDFKNALRAYKECQKVSKNNDMRVATGYWHYMTLRRMGNTKDASKVLDKFAGDVEVIENTDYLKLIKLNRGEIKAEALLSEIQGSANTLGSASLGYGIGNYYLYNGDKEKAMTTFRQIVAGDQWASFGYIAAETELARQKHDR